MELNVITEDGIIKLEPKVNIASIKTEEEIAVTKIEDANEDYMIVIDNYDEEYSKFYYSTMSSSNKNESNPNIDFESPEIQVISANNESYGDWKNSNTIFKRRRNVNEWKQNKKKMLKNAGQEYITISGRVVPEKRPLDCSDHSCRYKCTANFTEQERIDINRRYWGLGDYGKQRLFLNMTVISKECNRKTVSTTRRNTTFEYRLNNKRVCKVFYLATLNISDGSVMTVKNREKQNIDVTIDNRGKQLNCRKFTEEELDTVRQHIKCFPTVPSTKRNSTLRFIKGKLSIVKMYELYKFIYPDSRIKCFTYRNIFNNEFNLAFLSYAKNDNKSGDNSCYESGNFESPDPVAYSNNNHIKTEPKRSKAHLRPPRKVNEWKQTIKKSKKNSGQEYVNASGRIVPAKLPLDCSDHECRYKCATKFSEEARMKINRKYWGLADYGKQRLFISLSVLTKKCARKKIGESRRQTTFEYRLNDIKVCKVFYLATLNISDSIVMGVKVRERNDLDVTVDNRGKQANSRKFSETQLNEVRSHIISFETVTIKNSRRRYIKDVGNIMKMYELFKTQYPDTNIKSFTYRKIFKNEFNLSFLPEKKEEHVP